MRAPHYFASPSRDSPTNLDQICPSGPTNSQVQWPTVMVHRPDRLLRYHRNHETLPIWLPNGFNFVYPKVHKDANMLLIEAIKDGSRDGLKFFLHCSSMKKMEAIRRKFMRFTMETKAYMYVVQCADGTLYTGYTTDIERRIKTHNAGKGAKKYTPSQTSCDLDLPGVFPRQKRAAMSAESLFKRGRAERKN